VPVGVTVAVIAVGAPYTRLPETATAVVVGTPTTVTVTLPNVRGFV
jgi:hypothetical protein